jgi:hypothetical protein
MEASRTIQNGGAAAAAAEDELEPQRPRIRLEDLEVGKAPDPEKPLEVAHYVNAHMNQLWRMAKIFSDSGAVPAALRGNPAGCFVVLCNGYELGLAPGTAFRAIHPIPDKDREGNLVGFKVTFSADLIAGLAYQAGVRYQIIRSDRTGAVIKWRRGDMEGTSSFTEEDAKAAGLIGKPGDMYRKWPARMYLSRAKSFMGRDAAPDRCMNLHTPDEVDDVEGAPVPTPPDPEKDAAVGAAMRENQEARTATVAEQFPPAPAPAAAAPVRASDPPRPGQSTPAQRQKIGILARAVGRDTKEDRPNPVTGALEPRTVVKTNDEMNKALGLPEGENAAIAYLTAGQCVILIDLLTKEEAQLEERRHKEQEQRATDDAAEALGG